MGSVSKHKNIMITHLILSLISNVNTISTHLTICTLSINSTNVILSDDTNDQKAHNDMHMHALIPDRDIIRLHLVRLERETGPAFHAHWHVNDYSSFQFRV